MFQSSGFSLSLQTIREGFGLSATEAMAGGCLPVVSAVGAFPEVVRDGVDGFLVSGDPLNPATQAEAADVIHATASDPARDAALRRTAVAMPWDMPTAAAAWENVIAAALADRGR
jgi:glycosyltransferase involved in cell wall biosynthesis